MESAAFLFAGQGSQYIGMGKDLYESFPESKAIFDKAETVLGFNLKKLCFEGPLEELKATNVSQPAIVTVSIAAFETFKKASGNQLKVEYVAGLSLGEYSALIAAESLSLEDGLRLVKKRGEIMEAAARKTPGKMAAIIDLSFEVLRDICRESQIEIANFNAPGQVVISGEEEAIAKAKDLCLAKGAKRVIELEVSGGFHSSLMREASNELKAILDTIQISDPVIPLISNYTASPINKAVQIKECLVYQMYSPVRWEESMRFMLSKGIKCFIEFGPGRVLKGLMRRIDPNAQVISIEKKEDILNFKFT